MRSWPSRGAIAALLLAGCSARHDADAPPRAPDRPPAPAQTSLIAVPIRLEAETLRRIVDSKLPTRLWTINQHSSRCIKPERIKIFGRRINVTPPISCTIVGEVTRGPITLRGEGSEIVADVPLRAQVSARDIGGILKGETATGAALAHARIRLHVAPDWSPGATVRLSYGWTTPPGIDFLGQRITFAHQADAKLAPVIRKLEAELPRELAKVDLRAKVSAAWRRAFTSIELNRRDPPVWMRVTPRRLTYGGYSLSGPQLRLELGLEAFTETFVGPRPADPAATPLPPLARAPEADRVALSVPVVADYRELEPVVLRALRRREARPFMLPSIGAIRVRFHKVRLYGTEGGRIAAGVELSAKPDAAAMREIDGLFWLTARPFNQPGSARIMFDGLKVTGSVEGEGNDLIARLGASPEVTGLIAEALTQNFTKDVAKLRGKIERAIADKQTGDFRIRARLTEMTTGRIAAYGDTLYLPVHAGGSAEISYRPRA